MRAAEQGAQVTVALIAAFASLLVALLGVVAGYLTKLSSDRKLAELNDRLAEGQSARDAERDYRYEARKRVYSELQPLMFQMVESGESACTRIEGLAAAARENHLTPGDRWLDSGYYYDSTVYRLCAPLVYFRLCQERLTSVDLSVEPKVHDQYTLAKQLYLTWTNSRPLAGSEPAIPYVPLYSDERAGDYDPAVNQPQHIFGGAIDQLVEAMTIRDDVGVRCISYGAFEEQIEERGTKIRRLAAPLWYLLQDFHPRSKPVLWRMLLAQAHIHRALGMTMRTNFVLPATFAEGPVELGRQSSVASSVHPADAITESEWGMFDWRESGASETWEQAVVRPLTAVHSYLRQHVVLERQ
jgi:hypothetical protein